MNGREEALRKIGVGDIFNAQDAGGPSRTCLTMAVTGTTIRARAVTTQEIIEFDRGTGTSEHRHRGASYRYVINSTAALPPDIHEIMLSVDRKFGDAIRERSGDTRLTKEQTRGLLFVGDFYRTNSLPPP